MKKKLSLLAGGLAAMLALALAPAPLQAATPQSLTLRQSPDRYRAQILTLTIAEGALTLSGTTAPGLPPGTLRLEGLDVPLQPIELKAAANGRLSDTLSLPAGTYTLRITPAVWLDLTITGPGLQGRADLPALSLAGTPYQNANDGLTLAPTASGAGALLWSGPDGQGGLFTAHGTGYAPLTLPTSSLADGVYQYSVIAPDAGSGNVSIALRPILIDRQDTFWDLPADHWARRWVEVAYHLEIVTGRPDGSFAPEANVTRAEFAKLLAATLKLEGGAVEFVDSKSHWAAPWIAALGRAEIVKGDLVDGEPHFHPDRTISRQEAAAMVARAFQLQAAGPAPAFSDWEQIDSWAQSPVQSMVTAGWLSGFPDGSFGPKVLLSRSQAAKILGATFGMQ